MGITWPAVVVFVVVVVAVAAVHGVEVRVVVHAVSATAFLLFHAAAAMALLLFGTVAACVVPAVFFLLLVTAIRHTGGLWVLERRQRRLRRRVTIPSPPSTK